MPCAGEQSGPGDYKSELSKALAIPARRVRGQNFPPPLTELGRAAIVRSIAPALCVRLEVIGFYRCHDDRGPLPGSRGSREHLGLGVRVPLHFPEEFVDDRIERASKFAAGAPD